MQDYYDFYIDLLRIYQELIAKGKTIEHSNLKTQFFSSNAIPRIK